MKRSIILSAIFSLSLLCSVPKSEANELGAIAISGLTFLGAAGLGGMVLNQVEKKSFQAHVITIVTLIAAGCIAKKAYDSVKK